MAHSLLQNFTSTDESFETNVDLVGSHTVPLQLRWHLRQQNRQKTFTTNVRTVPSDWPYHCRYTVETYLGCEPGSSVAKHLITTIKTSCFDLLLHNIDRKTLDFSEAMVIQLHNPTVCALKPLPHTVCLQVRWHHIFIVLNKTSMPVHCSFRLNII